MEAEDKMKIPPHLENMILGLRPKKVSDKAILYASSGQWIESNAVTQFSTIASRPEIERAVAFPDLHLGKGGPVGAVFATREDVLLPDLIGNDIGCGMSFFQTDIADKKIKLDKWAKRLARLDVPYDESERKSWMKKFELRESAMDETLGTIGGGNHFAELQTMEKLYDKEAFSLMGGRFDVLYILVHSGSRALGQSVFHAFRAKYPDGKIEGAEPIKEYMESHKHAAYWAHGNRNLIAKRFSAQIGGSAECLVNAYHNIIEPREIKGKQYNLHRKGAAKFGSKFDEGSAIPRGVVIPGSRGTLSYLVVPFGDQSNNLESIAHGAGRKWARSDCRARLFDKYSQESLTRTELGSRVICEDKDLIYEEAPQAYKDIESVIDDLVDAGLVKVVATFRPWITYKTRRDS